MSEVNPTQNDKFKFAELSTVTDNLKLVQHQYCCGYVVSQSNLQLHKLIASRYI